MGLMRGVVFVDLRGGRGHNCSLRKRIRDWVWDGRFERGRH